MDVGVEGAGSGDGAADPFLRRRRLCRKAAASCSGVALAITIKILSVIQERIQQNLLQV
jgi:hypothetical protein